MKTFKTETTTLLNQHSLSSSFLSVFTSFLSENVSCLAWLRLNSSCFLHYTTLPTELHMHNYYYCYNNNHYYNYNNWNHYDILLGVLNAVLLNVVSASLTECMTQPEVLHCHLTPTAMYTVYGSTCTDKHTSQKWTKSQEILYIVTNLIITPCTLVSPVFLLYLVQPQLAVFDPLTRNP